jgi:hypothetical protein
VTDHPGGGPSVPGALSWSNGARADAARQPRAGRACLSAVRAAHHRRGYVASPPSQGPTDAAACMCSRVKGTLRGHTAVAPKAEHCPGMILCLKAIANPAPGWRIEHASTSGFAGLRHPRPREGATAIAAQVTYGILFQAVLARRGHPPCRPSEPQALFLARLVRGRVRSSHALAVNSQSAVRRWSHCRPHDVQSHRVELPA